MGWSLFNEITWDADVVHRKVIPPYAQDVSYLRGKFRDIVQREGREEMNVLQRSSCFVVFVKQK